MANDLTTHSRPQRPGLLSSLSGPELSAALTGRCDQERLLRAVRDLLGLYWLANDAPEERARQALLFVSDLAEFSDDVSGWAVSEWRRKNDRRPSIAGLRQLAMQRRHELTVEAKRRAPPADTGPSFDLARLDPAERARREAVIESCAKAASFVKQGGRYVPQKLIDEDDARRRAAGIHWSETAAPDDPRWAELRRARAEARKSAALRGEGPL